MISRVLSEREKTEIVRPSRPSRRRWSRSTARRKKTARRRPDAGPPAARAHRRLLELARLGRIDAGRADQQRAAGRELAAGVPPGPPVSPRHALVRPVFGYVRPAFMDDLPTRAKPAVPRWRKLLPLLGLVLLGGVLVSPRPRRHGRRAPAHRALCDRSRVRAVRRELLRESAALAALAPRAGPSTMPSPHGRSRRS